MIFKKKRKNKKLFKNKLQMCIYLFLYALCIFGFILISQINIHKETFSDSEKFSNVYKNVEKDNLYKFVDAGKVLEIVNGRSGIILMGFPSNKWTGIYAEMLNNIAKEYNIDEIYYYDFYQDRKEANGTYQTIVNKLSTYAYTNDTGKQNIFAPTIIMVRNGEVIAYLDDTSIIKGTVTPEIYYNDNQKAYANELIKSAINNYLGGA